MPKTFSKDNLPFLTNQRQGDNAKSNVRFKPSYYNFLFDSEDGAHLLFNAMSGAFTKVAEENIIDIQYLLSDPNGFTRDSERKTLLFQSAIKGGFIVKEEVNELEIIKTISLMGRFSTEHFHLTIMPTLECNFRCTYCYEDFKPGKMSKETMDALIKWADNKVKTCNKFSIGWFGGEPLMARDCIDYLSNSFRDISNKHEAEYSAVMSTNGYLMSNRVVDRFYDWGIKQIQVTIDGPPIIHDTLRVLKNGRGTYKSIVNNLEYLYAKMNDILMVLRVNCDVNTIQHVPRLLEELPNCIKQNAHIYLAEIYQCASFLTDNQQKEIIQSDGYLHRSNTSSMRQKIQEMNILAMKYKNKSGISNSSANYNLRPKLGHCNVEYANRFVVDPTGGLFKCTIANQSDKFKVGQIHLNGEATFNLPRLTLWLSKDPIKNEACKSCKILPLCMGGCHSANLKNPNSSGCAAPMTSNEILPVLKKLYKEGAYNCS